MNEIYDWSTIRAAYVLGISHEDGSRRLPTLAELSEQYGVGMSTITHRSAREDWPRLRKEAQARIYQDACQRFEGELAEKLSKCDKLAVDTSLLVMQTIHDALADPTLERRERLQLANKYVRVMAAAMSLLHRGYGVEMQLDELEELQDKLRKQDGAA